MVRSAGILTAVMLLSAFQPMFARADPVRAGEGMVYAQNSQPKALPADASSIQQRRYWERRARQLEEQQQISTEQQRSVPVPPTNPNSKVVPNR
jgi:hypothetical protein